jgi:small-conductance mechanosensitive channel
MVLWQNTVRDYIFALATLAAIILILALLKRLVLSRIEKFAARTANDLDDFLVGLIGQIGMPVFAVTALYLATQPLVLTESARNLVRYCVMIVVAIRVILMLQTAVRYGVTKAYRRRVRTDDPATAAMIKTTIGILNWVIWILGLVFVLDNLGINISALVAGIGIGGIAVAMASQGILGGAFSALSIFLDKPFEIGDSIEVDDHSGTVEHIGVKTTRIRSISGEQLILANSDLTKSRIKNYKRMDSRRVVFKLGVVYQTSYEKARKIPELVKVIFGATKDLRLDRVHFQSFGDFALIYEVVYYVLSADYNVYMDKQQEINFALMKTFAQEGIEFAYPTQTVYMQQLG